MRHAGYAGYPNRLFGAVDVKTVKTGVPELARIWQEHIAALQPAQALKQWTGKEYGQLRVFSDAVSRAGLDPTALMVFALKNWELFAAMIRVEEHLPRSPDRPHIGYLLKFREWLIAAWIAAD
ncbi:hypothetical protein PUN4_780056 [Paraburkholderia unamae]|uniref:hypothetical protein n=1 Tax=Paraburkholderia unamae TaxID=219649 RepID=UPI001CAD9125|nr:hypothetical protein [Paraburkholderia unamae]CAG9273463.1 hypothetical protein PUN4_780056 [Paraburkholderia unamae]